MAASSAFRVTQHSQTFSLFFRIEFNALRFINYTIPRLCSTYAEATLVLGLDFALVPFPKALKSNPVEDVTSPSHQNFFLEVKQTK